MTSCIKFPIELLKRAIRVTRSLLLSMLIDEGDGRFVICDHDLRVNIQKGRNSKIILNGKCKLKSCLGGKTPINVHLGENATLVIDGDFTIGNGVRISVSKNAKLILGGRQSESDSGITCDATILVNERIQIGKDFICAWNTFITDCDWHQIDGYGHTSPVVIGDHVWIANNCSILKGTTIGAGCIVASHSKLCCKSFDNDSLIGGVPAKVLRQPVTWKRDM